jgi:RNA polymerase sigma-70 factor (sigma-E family)
VEASVRDRSGFDEYVIARSPHLLRLAYLLTRNWQTAEDLLQTALVKVWSAWDRLDTATPDAYVRRVVMTTHLSWRRRRWTGEIAAGDLTDHEVSLQVPDQMRSVDERDRLWRRIGELPPRQRAVLVLRYFEDLSDEQIADVLGIGLGGVRSQVSRALAKLRDVMDDPPDSDDVPPGPTGATLRRTDVSR